VRIARNAKIAQLKKKIRKGNQQVIRWVDHDHFQRDYESCRTSLSDPQEEKTWDQLQLHMSINNPEEDV